MSAGPPAGEPVALVLAKAPVPGRVKTRLARTVGDERAAELAALALLDTLDACEDAFGAGRCHLALAGSLADATHGGEIAERLRRWTVHEQHGDDFGARLARAHADATADTGAPVVQVGMDTPQVTAADLRDVAAMLADSEAVIGPAPDGGWWVLALRDAAHAHVLRAVEMSTEHTMLDTVRALQACVSTFGTARSLRDVDTAADADLVAAHGTGRFARGWQACRAGVLR